MDANTILELEALKMEARAIEIEALPHPYALGYSDNMREIATRIRALKTVEKEDSK